MGEAHALRVDPEQARVLGGRERGAVAAERREQRSGLPVLARRGEQKRAPRERRERGDARSVDLLQAAAGRQPSGQQLRARPLRGGQLGGRLDEREGVAAERVHQRLRHPSRDAVAPGEAHRVGATELSEREPCDARPRLGRVTPDRPHRDDHDAEPLSAPGHEPDDRTRRGIEPLEVVDRHEQRRGRREQRRHRMEHHRAVVPARRIERQRGAQSAALRVWEAVDVVEHRVQELDQPGERQVDLRLHAGGGEHGHAGRSHHRLQQRALPDAWRPFHEQRGATAGPRAVDQRAQPLELRRAADQLDGVRHGHLRGRPGLVRRPERLALTCREVVERVVEDIVQRARYQSADVPGGPARCGSTIVDRPSWISSAS
ncbi:MAG: hypothetical protein R2736_03880 [Solirubrobacterales bacterium]